MVMRVFSYIDKHNAPHPATLVLEDGSKWEGLSFGHEEAVAGEAVFTTGMVGYPESMTDPSYYGQILIFSYPLVGNYGVPEQIYWESEKIHTAAIIVSAYTGHGCHFGSTQTLAEWLKKEHIPGIEIKDTRGLIQKIREQGVMMGKIVFDRDIDFYDPNAENLVSHVSTKTVIRYNAGSFKLPMVSNVRARRPTVILIDCGVKKNTIRSLIARGVDVVRVPWDYDVMSMKDHVDGVVVSNGPGDPKMVPETIEATKKLLRAHVPILGICLGNQVLALASGGDTFKMKFGHRSQNQPCKIHDGSGRYYLTTQNHSYAVGTLPEGFTDWFTNANDGTNEGIIHTSKPFMSVQFHPEACPGPTDTSWIFDKFITILKH